jgi:8-oxo-dGTP diphosphatase
MILPGVGVIVLQNLHRRIGEDAVGVILGKRLSPPGIGCFALPSGLVEDESIIETAKREVEEETGLVLKKVTDISPIYSPRRFRLNSWEFKSHYCAAWIDGTETPELKEPTKCEGWKVYKWCHFPEPLFSSFERFVRHVSLEKLLNFVMEEQGMKSHINLL